MRLAEDDGKALLRRHGLAVPRSVLLGPGEEPPDEAGGWPGFLLKAQMLEGGRGKRGLVRRFAEPNEFREARRLILATLDDADTPLLLEEAVPIAREIFVAVRVDGTRQRLELLLAPQGGENVEQSAKLARIPIDVAARRRRRSFPPIARIFPRDACGAAGPLRGAAAGNRPPGGFGAPRNQSAGADRRTAASSPATPRSSAMRPPTSATIRTSFR